VSQIRRSRAYRNVGSRRALDFRCDRAGRGTLHLSIDWRGRMSSQGFASVRDTEEKKISFEEVGSGLYAFTAEGDPNSGIIVGDDSVMVIDAQATPVMAEEVIERVARVTDKPIKYVLLSHYHAVRVLGASAFAGAEIIASDTTRGLIVER